MTNVGFPIFELKATKSFIFIGGGGGNKEYGKKNGIIAIRKEDISRNSNKLVDFFETDDFILQIGVYTTNPEEQIEPIEKQIFKNAPKVHENSEDSDSVVIESTENEDLELSEKEKVNEEDFNEEIDDEVSIKEKNDDEDVTEEIDEDENVNEENDEEVNVNEETEEDDDVNEEDENVNKEIDDVNANKEIDDVNEEDDIIEEDKNLKENPIFITAIGDEKFYLFKFDGKFKLIASLNKKVKQAEIKENLILHRNNRIAGFYDITNQKKPVLDFKIRKISESIKDLAEEHVYKIYKKGERLVFMNDMCTEDIPETWEGFFTNGNQIHKISKKGESNVFVFQNQKYEIEGKMSQVIAHKQKIVFYSNKDKDGYLYFIDSSSKMYKLPKLTAICQFKDLTCVATCLGEVIIYVDGIYHQKIDASQLPITGINVDSNKVIFSNLNGDVDVVKYSNNAKKILYFGWILALIIAIVFSVLKFYK